MPEQKKLFLIGPGFIGGSLLVRLKEVRPDLELSALTRRDDQANELAQLGIKPIKGGLDDVEVIRKHSSISDIIIHTATADHEASTFAVVEGIKSRMDKTKKIIFIHTSGNDELLHSAKGLEKATVEERMLSDAKGNEYLEKRFQPDAPHRQVDGPLQEMIANPEQEEEHNASVSIIVPPHIYGIGSKPWERISIQTPMLTRAMMEKGIVALPKDHPGAWNAVWVHDLVESYIVLLAELEKHKPGTPQPSSFFFPAEPETFLWRDVFDAVASVLKQAGHPCAKSEAKELDANSFYEFIGGKDNPYAPFFQAVVFAKDNSYTKPDRLLKLGFQHKSKGVLDSILNGKELDPVLAETKDK